MALVFIPFLICCTCIFLVLETATRSAGLQRGQLVEIKALAWLLALIISELIIVAGLLLSALLSILFFLTVLIKFVTLSATSEAQLLQALTAYMLVHQAILTGISVITSVEIVIKVVIADFIILIITVVIHIEVAQVKIGCLLPLHIALSLLLFSNLNYSN